MSRFTTAVLLFVLIVGAVSAAPVMPRVVLTAEQVAKDGRWQKLADRIGLQMPNLFKDTDGAACGEVESLPLPLIGQMYGGSWGAQGSQLQQVLPGGWRQWSKGSSDGVIPGVMGKTDKGVIIHAQLGKLGGHAVPFLFVGSASGATGSETDQVGAAQQLQDAVTNGGAYWDAFSTAVMNTQTGKDAMMTKAVLAALMEDEGKSFYQGTDGYIKILKKGQKPPKQETPAGGAGTDNKPPAPGAGGPGGQPAAPEAGDKPAGGGEKAADKDKAPSRYVKWAPWLSSWPLYWFFPAALLLLILFIFHEKIGGGPLVEPYTKRQNVMISVGIVCGLIVALMVVWLLAAGIANGYIALFAPLPA